MKSFTTNGNQKQERNNQVSFVRSHLILLESRKKWGILYSLATVSGLFFIPGVLEMMWSGASVLTIFQKVIPLPAISFLITVGMYVLNDLVDADLDRANGKKRPISSGLVSKKQTLVFIILTNSLALLLSIITLNPVSILIVSLMLVLGISYSDPKVALMKRFVTKTIAISIYYALCALLGVTSSYSLDLAIGNPVILVNSLLMLSIMIFISSTLNDLGDVEGDRGAGRRTIPIVIGGDNTIKLSMILAICMLPITWTLYTLTVATGNHGSIIAPASTSLFALLVASKMSNMRKGLHDMESMRRHHKRLFPLHLILQSNLVVGALIML